MESATLYKEDEAFFLRAALKLGDEFMNWIGFDASEETLDIRP